MCKLNENQLEEIACRVAKKMIDKRKKGEADTRLTPEESLAVKQILATKKRAVQFVFLIFTAAVMWALKDIYIWIKKSFDVFSTSEWSFFNEGISIYCIL